MSHRPTYQDQFLAAALAYAEGGWSVFPLRPGSKRPAVPTHTASDCDRRDHRCAEGHLGWEERATTNPRRITKAWRRHPYGIGIACGPAGLLVVDLDTAKNDTPAGTDSLARLEHHHGQTLPATWTVGTPTGGRHLYYLQPTDKPLGNTAGRAGPGIDTRGQGGYVVAPPTRITSGDYWLIDDHPPAELPTWFAHLLTTPPKPRPSDARPRSPQTLSGDRVSRYVARAIEGELDRISAAPEGQRNHALFCSAIALGQLVGAQVLNQSEAQQLLLDAAQTHIQAGAYSTTQARQTIASGMRRGTNEPRQIPTQPRTATAGARP